MSLASQLLVWARQSLVGHIWRSFRILRMMHFWSILGFLMICLFYSAWWVLLPVYEGNFHCVVLGMCLRDWKCFCMSRDHSTHRIHRWPAVLWVLDLRIVFVKCYSRIQLWSVVDCRLWICLRFPTSFGTGFLLFLRCRLKRSLKWLKRSFEVGF